MDIKETIVKVIHEAASHRESEIVEGFDGNSILLDSGLDSLGYAIVVALLEEELNYDPFSLMEEPVYPKTLNEFIDIYKNFSG